MTVYATLAYSISTICPPRMRSRKARLRLSSLQRMYMIAAKEETPFSLQYRKRFVMFMRTSMDRDGSANEENHV